MTAGDGRAEVGMATMALAMLAAPLADVIAKLLTDSYSPGQIGLARFGFQTVFLAGVMLAWRARLRRPTVLHGLAGLMIALSVLLFVWSLKYLSVATATAIFFLEPLLLLVLSHPADCRGLGRLRRRSPGDPSQLGGILAGSRSCRWPRPAAMQSTWC